MLRPLAGHASGRLLVTTHHKKHQKKNHKKKVHRKMLHRKKVHRKKVHRKKVHAHPIVVRQPQPTTTTTTTTTTSVATAPPPTTSPPAPTPSVVQGSKLACVYSAHSLSTLAAFDALVHRDFNCALVYNDAAPDWASWENPWFIGTGITDNRWATWATQPGYNRRLVITQNLFPASLNGTDWRIPGALGGYTDHARNLARNLVAAGLGDAIIRLAHEANGTWYPDSIGSTPFEAALWVYFWRQTVIAMRSVPGAKFTFDWTINAAVRPVPLSSFYPGDDVVDIIGIDAYDAGVPAGVDRWSTIYNRTDGIGDVVNFARLHGKPLSIPEWGVGSNPAYQTAGDDPRYVNGIAEVVKDNNVAYQSYFYKYDWATQLATGPLSLAAYRAHFGSGSDSVAP